MALLESIERPADLKMLSTGQLAELASEIRDFLVEEVCRTGGHLGSNLGVVELTIALHRVFESPYDRIIWDTGHQAYVHKILTGRWRKFDQLRQKGGLSGYPSRDESEHDVIENSHASTALSYADGIAKGYQLAGFMDRAVVAVIGDGALTGGMAWEGLNNISGARDRPVVIVINDNGRSYAPTIGGFARHLAALRTARSDDGLAARGMLEGLGLRYIGPLDGHDIAQLESALRKAAQLKQPTIVHCVTQKGRGFAQAENDLADCLHAVRPGAFSPANAPGETVPSWTSAFGEELLKIGAERPEVVAITAAMLEPTGLSQFARAFPDRTFDVGIAEQQAVVSAAGLAMAGMLPVVCIYATFLNRAFDQLLMDVSLHGCPVVLILDRAGVTGDDGPSHNGMWDLSVLSVIPGLRIGAPRDAAILREQLREAVDSTDGPTVLRFPKGIPGPEIPSIERYQGIDILRRDEASTALIVSVGAMAGTCLEAADVLAGEGVHCDVADPRWLAPASAGLIELAERYRLVISVEDNVRSGGFGTQLSLALADALVTIPTLCLGLPKRFLAQGKRGQILEECGLTGPAIARSIAMRLTGLGNPAESSYMEAGA
jgi:1-deoxy-D-xylulose-5-phosphate synthase